MKKSFSLSLLFHLLVLAALIVQLRRVQRLEAPQAPLSVVVEDFAIPSKKAAKNGGGHTARLGSAGARRKSVDLSKLGVFGSLSRGAHNGSPDANAKSEKPDGYQTAEAMNLAQESELYPFFQGVWEKVNQSFIYPADFVNQRITGSVTVELEVGRDGVFTGHVFEVHGEEPLLNTFVLATITSALKHPLRTNLWMKKGPIALVLHFDFALFGPSQEPTKPLFAHFKNLLNFKRDAYADPWLNYQVEKIITRYVPPILILPGVVYVDVIRAYEFYKNWGKIDSDQLRKDRMDLNDEAWQRAIRENTGS